MWEGRYVGGREGSVPSELDTWESWPDDRLSNSAYRIQPSPCMRSCHVIRFGTLFSVFGNACVRLRHNNLAAWLLNAARSGRHAVSSAALGAGHLALGRHLMALALQPHQQPTIPSLLAAAEGGSISVCSPGKSLSLPPSPLIAADECTRAYALRYAMQHLSLALSFSAKAEDSADGVIGKAAGSGGHAPGRAEEAGKLLMSGVASWDLIGRVFEAGYGVDAVHALDCAVRLLGSPPPRSLPLPPRTAGFPAAALAAARCVPAWFRRRLSR